MKKVSLSLALSLDGYIADENGKFDWITGDGHGLCDTEKSFDFMGFLETVDTIVMGKKAFDDCGIEMFSNHKIVVFTHEKLENTDHVKYVSGDVVQWLQEEMKTSGKGIYIFGGGQVAFPIIEKNMIDEYLLGIIPIILGKGRKLFLGEHDSVSLKTEDVMVDDGQIIVKYTRR